MKYALFIFFVFNAATISFSQTPMVAYRVEGVWHYYNTDGKKMWEPFADRAANPKNLVNGLFSADEMQIKGKNADDLQISLKQVLYNGKGEVVFDPKLPQPYRIVSGFDAVGLAQVIDNETGILYLFDKSGKKMFTSPHQYCQYLGDGVVSYLKRESDYEDENNKEFVLFDVKTNKILTTLKCFGFHGNYAEGAVLCYDPRLKFGIVNRAGALIQPMVWHSETVLDQPEGFISGHICLKKDKSDMYSLINASGKELLNNIITPGYLQHGYFKGQVKHNNEDQYLVYRLLPNEAVPVSDQIYVDCQEPTTGGFISCFDLDYTAHILDKNGKPAFTVKQYEDAFVLEKHIWIKIATSEKYQCYSEKGVLTDSLHVEKIGKPAYGYVPFQQDGLWGLASETGKVVVAPAFKFDDDFVPELENGYWLVTEQIGNNNDYQFHFYNFKGKRVLSTQADKDGWDYIVPFTTMPYYFIN